MSNNPFFKQLAAMQQAQTRIVETLGVPYADPFNEEAIIADVNDPKKLGRVKVTTKNDITSDWIPVSGSNSGTLSARYIGASVLVGKMDGRSENMYVIGITRNEPDVGITGNPLQLPIIDESIAVWNGSTDSGMRCNEGNEGRMYVLSNEMNQDVVVCLRRTSKQVGSNQAWAWKSMTNGLWVEKGINPGNESTPAISQTHRSNPGIPECTESMLGEIHDFTEDRGFRTTTMVCRRDENKNFSWMPLSSPPVFFRTTLPTCSEKIHGMEAVLDDGNNSEFMVCQRYQGLMRWVRQGRRIPHKFYSKEKPLSRIKFTTAFNAIKALEENSKLNENDKWQQASDIIDAAFDAAMSNIPITGTDPELKKLLELAGMVPATAFDGAQTIQRVAREALRKKTGIPVETITQLIREELDSNGSLTPETAELLSGLGSSLDVLINGTVDGDINSALLQIGQSTLRNALLGIEPKAAAVMTGLMSGGINGAIDSAVAIGLDQLPPEVNKYVKPVVEIAKDLLMSKYPASLSNILNSASGGGLISAVTSTINGAVKNNIVNPGLLTSLTTELADGSLGEIPKMFSALGNLDAIVKTPANLGSLPVLATTAMGLIGQANAMKDLLGNGGIGLDNVDKLIGGTFSSASTIVGAIKGLGSILGGSPASSDCPCDPTCRKTAHGEDSDRNNLIEPCESMTANNSNSFVPTGNSLQNNIGPIARSLGLSPTGIGANLIPKNPRNLSGYLRSVVRAGQMAEKFFDSRYADEVEKISELAYTIEAIEKGFKITDNNITRIESVEKKLIDSLYNLLSAIVYNRKGSGRNTAILPRIIRDIRENSRAIKDLYRFTRRLDAVKRGGKAGVYVTNNLALSFRNIPDLQRLLQLNRKEAIKVLRGGVIPAYRDWKSMDPGSGENISLGRYGKTFSDPYGKEKTLFDRDRVLSISLESKIGDNSPPQEDSGIDLSLSPSQISSLQSLPSSTSGGAGSSTTAGRSVLSDLEDIGSQALNDGLNQEQIDGLIAPYLNTGEGSLYDAIVDREGQSNCE